MYVIEYQEWVFTYCIDKKETFTCSQVGDFFHRVKELRDLGTTITSTYFLD